MTKKRRKSPPRHIIIAPNQPPIDRLATWLGNRSRAVRGLICGGVALSFTIALALLLYGSLFNVPANQAKIGPINLSDLPLVLLVLLSITGLVLYWVGWRVMIGFDADEMPLQPGRPAALWVLIGASVFVLTVLGAVISLILAIGS